MLHRRLFTFNIVDEASIQSLQNAICVWVQQSKHASLCLA